MSRKTKAGVLVPQKAERFDFWSHLPVLQSERAADFDALLNTLTREVKPRGVIEHMYVNDIAFLVWEMLRLRRCKTAIVKAAFRTAIKAVLETMIMEPDDVIDLRLAEKWFSSEKAKDQVRKLLARFQLDESAIEAEAFRHSSRDLEILDRMLMGLETRRDKALACIAGYRNSLAHQLRESANHIIEPDARDVPRLEDASVPIAVE